MRMPSLSRSSFSLTIVDTILLVGTMNAKTSKRLKARAAAAAPRSIVTAGQGKGLIATSTGAGSPPLPIALPKIALRESKLRLENIHSASETSDFDKVCIGIGLFVKHYLKQSLDLDTETNPC